MCSVLPLLELRLTFSSSPNLVKLPKQFGSLAQARNMYLYTFLAQKISMFIFASLSVHPLTTDAREQSYNGGGGGGGGGGDGGDGGGTCLT